MKNQIPVIILAGGLGTRLSEETDQRPKPMVQIGDRPMLWHIMKIYASQGFNNFVIATGYKHEVIDSWINENKDNNSFGFECNVKTLFTGENTQTGGRIKRCLEHLSVGVVMATYGDGLANVNLDKSLNFHLREERLATVTAVRPPARFGYLEIEGTQVRNFGEKHQADVGWINGGFFILNTDIKSMILGDSEPFETGALPKLAHMGQLGAFHHYDFWQPMDTLREKQELTRHATQQIPPWLFGI